MIPIFLCGSRRSKGVLSGTAVFLRLLVGELWTPKLAKIFAYGKWLYPYRMLLELGLSNDPPPPNRWGGIAAGVFLVQYTLYYKKRQELQLAQAAFPQGGPENNYIAIVATEIFSVNK